MKILILLLLKIIIYHKQQENEDKIKSLTEEIHALSWLNCSPSCPERSSILPFHFTILSRSIILLSVISSENENN